MPELRIKELELQLATANDSVARLTLANAELTKGLADSEHSFRKLKRSSRSNESNLASQLTVAQNMRK